MKKIIITSIFYLVPLLILAQSDKLKNYVENYDYTAIINKYNSDLDKDNISPEVLMKLGDAYFNNANYKDAGIAYGQLFEKSTEAVPAEYYIRYSQCLKSIGDYAKSKLYMDKYAVLKNDDSRSEKFLDNKDYINKINNIKENYNLKLASINTEHYDYGGSFSGDTFVFTSTRKNKFLSNTRNKWNDEPFSTLFAVKLTSEDEFKRVKSFSKTINTKLNESSIVFTKDNKTAYFTRNNFINGEKGVDAKNTVLLKLYKAEFVDGKWTNIVELPFNSNEYSVAHPALSNDNKTLYFASNMPGTIGESDIFSVTINADGTYGQPQNLGNRINTEGRETFPYISPDDELYFSSNGHLGLGGLDIFVTKKMDNSKYALVQNLGKPLNSAFDDFGFVFSVNSVDENGKRKGFVTSNRPGGKGYDDIYQFVELEKVSPVIIEDLIVTGFVYDAKTNNPLYSSVVLLDEKGNTIATANTDSKGNFTFQDEISKGVNYTVKVMPKGYSSEEKAILLPLDKTSLHVDIPCVKETVIVSDVDASSGDEIKLNVGDDLAKVFNLEIIYFDFDKSNIRPDAEIELRKILKVMNDYPSLKIAIGSHTDCRASNTYNDALSNRRAKSTFNWLVKNGISKDRLTYKGFGENQLVNNCANGVPCSEEAHQLNRRSEFIIVEK